jgi:hypothetical protein
MFKIKFCNFEYGRKNTGGYSIGIESVSGNQKYNYQCQREVRARSMVTQVITYPFCVVKLILKEIIIK